jgi:hypothetical protein
LTHAELALPALWIAPKRNGAVLGMPPLNDLMHVLPQLP